jgi:hypothetical protein
MACSQLLAYKTPISECIKQTSTGRHDIMNTIVPFKNKIKKIPRIIYPNYE